MKLIYLGPRFYNVTSTMMNGLIHEDGAHSDWGKVQIACECGEDVSIRQASAPEREWGLARADELIDMYAKTGWVHGLGNFDHDNPPADLQERVATAKRYLRGT